MSPVTTTRRPSSITQATTTHRSCKTAVRHRYSCIGESYRLLEAAIKLRELLGAREVAPDVDYLGCQRRCLGIDYNTVKEVLLTSFVKYFTLGCKL